MVLNTHRHTVVGYFRTATEGDVVVMYVTRAGRDFREVGIISHVSDVLTHCFRCRTKIGGVKHFYILIDALETNRAAIGNVKLLGFTLLRSHLNDTGSTAAAILRRL